MKIFEILKLLSDELNSTILHIITLFPDNRFGIRIRRIYYNNSLKYAGRNINIFSGALIYSPCRMQIGNNVSINHGSFIDPSEGEIIIKNNVLIGPYCILRAANHIFSNPEVPIINQGHEFGKIIIEDDVWLGANVVVLPNVRIGRGYVIGAGAVVTKDIEPYSIAVGIPARKVGCRGKK